MEVVEKITMPQEEKENIISQAVSNYGGKLMSYIRPKVKNTEDAEDILQEVWFQFSNLTNLSEIVNIGGWLYRVTANKITDRYRKKKTENLEDFVYEDENGEFSIKDILLMDDTAGPEIKMFQDEIWKKLFDALEELPEKQRLVYVENELNDKTLQEIADEQGENIKTIISRKNYAVKHLRKRLRQLYEDLNS
ncbi:MULTISPECIES: RNA polymerase sigma factor [Chryseobacterium]|uniref:ECF RNA polymerase sigma factor SigR n=4 Tax=Chryseobacterium TaxID=59732 RepID=A0A6N4XE96_9FLAO|nr:MULTISPECIES: sigma-70 family RNA polymerase sigma factor [Chryseobacterium]RNA62677.1 sigma-70 family RNA polymerase sigma factor [Chryseobacterium nematophagum]CAA7196967.1 ECF RNA polymerase sigma factor SigR [Chryseobacterium potabilaquae]CAA7388298.1 ECF RNA polymerase sigma factor SigR [Chryseobacterium fistulae]